MKTESFKGVLLSTLVIASVVVLISFAPFAKVFANPIIPGSPIPMPEEYIYIELTSIDGVIRAKVDGAYLFSNAGYDFIDMYYPVPPDSGNISVELLYDPIMLEWVPEWVPLEWWELHEWVPLEWFYSGLMYPTIVGDWPMIQCFIDFAPQNFVIKTHYEHEVPVLDDVYTFVYAMRSGEYAPYWPPYWPEQTTAYVTVRIDFIPTNLKVYAGSEPINYETTVEDGVTILTLTRTSDEFQPFLEDLIITFKPKSEFSLVTLYEVNLDVDLWLETNSKLVVKFYTWGDDFEGENVVWSGTAPDNVILLEDIPHPQGKAVEKVRLDLTQDNTENVISTIASFTVCKDDLRTRYRAIPKEWGLEPTPEGKAELRNEYRKIPGQWGLSPC